MYAYDTADIMDNDNYATVLENFVISSSLLAATVNTENISGLDHLVLILEHNLSYHTTWCLQSVASILV